MINLLEQIFPIWGIGLTFSFLYLLVSWFSVKLNEKDRKNEQLSAEAQLKKVKKKIKQPLRLIET